MSTCINRTVQLEIEIGIHAHDLPLLKHISARHLLAARNSRVWEVEGALASLFLGAGTGGRGHRIMMKLREREREREILIL